MTSTGTLEIPELRKQISQCIGERNGLAARGLLSEYWKREKGPAAAAFVASSYNELRGNFNLLPCRVAILRSFTVEPVAPLLQAAAFIAGFDLTIHIGDFNSYAQEILDPESGLYEFKPDAVVLAVQTRDIAPDLWSDYSGLSESQRVAAVNRVVHQFADLIRVFRANSEAHLIIHTLEEPVVFGQGLLDSQTLDGQSETIRHLNKELRKLARTQPGVYILDYDSLVARHGRCAWHDERKWLAVRMPVTSSHLIDLAEEWIRILHPLTGKVAKALVVDLDNTLWGGVIGEDGMDGIQIGPEYPGASYQELQRVMRDFYHRGILLAVCSKNNLDDALEVFDKHPGMILGRRHFASMRINWQDKVQNLREIASELNIGLDALAFLDDNPVEREQIRAALPEVAVLEIPPDPFGYASALRTCPLFERLVLSEEDKQRGGYYVAQRERLELETACASKEGFLRSLQQEVEIAAVDSATLARVAQLTQKTNQFNLTTRRYSEQEVAEMVSRRMRNVFSVRVRDRFGDNGLVGVAITFDQGNVREIESFLLSCRVIGRSVETAVLSYIAQDARNRGLAQILGRFLPTKKNAPARDFYTQHGFSLDRTDTEGSLWTLQLSNGIPACPEWIKLTIRQKDDILIDTELASLGS